ncbi:MAG: hypothetical protein ACYDAO_02360 [Thermoplasmataceae archaeon]
MDEELIIKIIRLFQWPGDDSLKSWPESDIKRPTSYWIYQKICENSVNSEKNHYSRSAVFKCYEKAIEHMMPRFIVDPKLFSYSMFSVLFIDDPLLSEKKIREILAMPNVELVQRGLGMSQLGLIPILSVNILLRNSEDPEPTIQKILELSDSIKIFYRVPSFLFPPKEDWNSKLIYNSEGIVRSKLKDIMCALINEPLIPLNALSRKTGIGKDKIYKEYENLGKSGPFKIEYSIKNPTIGEISLLQNGFAVNNEDKKNFLDYLNKFPLFRERLLICRWSFDNIIYTVSWAKDYSDFLDYHSNLAEYIGNETPLLTVWEPRTYFNRDAWVNMVRSNDKVD